MFKVTIKTPERRRSGVFIVNFKHISHLFLVFLLLNLNKSFSIFPYIIKKLFLLCNLGNGFLLETG